MDRRISQREFETVLDVGTTWFNRLIARGLVPAPRRDPGSRKNFWLESEARATFDKMNANAQRVTLPEQKIAA